MTEPALLPYDESLLHAIVDASPAGMLIVDKLGKIVLANRAASEQFGYEIDELLGNSIEILIPEARRSAHMSHRARYMVQPEHRSMAAGRNLFGTRKDGTELPVDVSLHPVRVGDETMVLANVLDATDRRRAEEERDQRLRLERLALLGQLAGGVAHEIRTPLCVIRNDTYFLKMLADGLGPEGVECINEINEAVGKAERIVSELLDFTRDPQSKPRDVKISDIVKTAIRDSSLPETIHVVTTGDDTTAVCVDEEQIERILVNLLRNGCQAMQDSGTLRIDTTCFDDHVMLEVVDSGPGIAPEHLDRVFEPLFTTKPKGIGLGLAVSHRYAERNGCKLTVSNAEAVGARFQLKLPRLPPKQEVSGK